MLPCLLVVGGSISVGLLLLADEAKVLPGPTAGLREGREGRVREKKTEREEEGGGRLLVCTESGTIHPIEVRIINRTMG